MMKSVCLAAVLAMCLGGCVHTPAAAPEAAPSAAAPTPPTRMTPEQQQSFRARCESRGGEIDWLESRVESGIYHMGCRLPNGRAYGFSG
ncbi:hypothetical protein [Neisseria shayeganii]|uniref:Lipoprotein n=1 Tax=Neisseria shayeganii TaxID=607712 RepID=A0A7D7SR12_9NEIS|nr:hypothetical protein [Neisseria shayeganii]QMT41510.1 hypothetical protein H3L94_05675 [Neisseria shayeganii]